MMIIYGAASTASRLPIPTPNSTNPNVRTNIGYVKEKELYVQFPRDATRGANTFHRTLTRLRSRAGSSAGSPDSSHARSEGDRGSDRARASSASRATEVVATQTRDA